MGIQEDYQTLVEKQFKEWQAQAEKFKETATQMEVNARAQFEKNLDFLRQSQTQAWENFNKLKQHNDTTWDEFKAHMDKAGTELRSAAEAMTRGFKS
jgi:transketolase